MENAADIIVIPKDVAHAMSPDAGEGPVLERPEDPSPAPHRMDGIMLMYGRT